MPIIIPEHIKERGKNDARRHREKQKEIIKEQLPGIIAEESIITGKPGKIIKVPIKSLEIPYFKSGKPSPSVGVGQGGGNKGDIIGKRKGFEKEKGHKRAGNEPGVDYIETEIEIEELIEMAMEDLGLPRLEEKTVKKLIIELGYKIHGISRSGPPSLLHRGKTVKEGIRRFWAFLNALRQKSGSSEFLCYRSLKQANGNINEAIRLLKDNAVDISDVDEKIEPFPILHPEDLRYRKIQESRSYRSQAVVFAMMDVSYSMDMEKKYFARSMFWWLVTFLRNIYQEVQVRFIAHDTTAWLVNEEEFFHTGEMGGTYCASAYELVKNLIETEYPVSVYNVYAWHFSDGDDFNAEAAAKSIQKLLDMGINMIGYGEIHSDKYTGQEFSDLLKTYINKFNLPVKKEDNFLVWGRDELSFMAVVLCHKSDLWPAIKAFLRKDR